MNPKDETGTFSGKTRKAWRNWLARNHEKKQSVWLVIFHKSHDKSTLDYRAAVEEALCFGWIDSKANKKDRESYYQFFSKRKPKSNWSKANRDRVKQLIDAGLMMPAGQAMIDLAKKSGTWKALADVQKNIVPDDLKKALQKSKAALKNFESFPPSSKRIILEWILNAKKSETRQKRIKETVELAKKNQRANHYRQ